MSQQQRIYYIFNEMDARTGKRFEWLYVLLGDIQTLIDGFQAFQNTTFASSFGLPLGGGNVSIAILVCTGLELVSALHAGKTNYFPQKGYNATDNLECFEILFCLI
jgi:hypothetical protein